MNLKPFLSADYQGFESFRDNVLAPIFGAGNIDESQRYDWLDIDSEYRAAAHRANIVEAWLMAKIDIGDSEFHVYDITVGYGSHLAQSRVGIRNFITNSILPTYANAFIIFHYADTAGRPWRFSYVYKGASGSDTTEAHRFTYLFGQGIPCRTAEERFNTLHDGEINDTTLRKAFSVEALSDEFFYKYLGYYASFVKYFTGQPTAKERGEKAITDRNFRQVVSEMDALGIANTDDQYHTDFLPHFGGDEQLAEKGVRDYVKKMMGRIVFLHFLQKKGWMGVPCDKADWTGGDENFMWHLYEHATDEQRDDLLDKVLEPLFFGMLNTKPEERAALFAECGWDTSLLDAWQKVPYLNGGLFEREAIDELPSRFPKEYFERFLSFLGEYNFTIDENDPNDAEVGVDPEMLGKIFESLLEDNKDKGAYYTPKEIVQYMCKESLIGYLCSHIDGVNGDDICQLVKNHIVIDERDSILLDETNTLLRRIKICDPAIGSGAFPMGFLNEIFVIRRCLHDCLDIVSDDTNAEIKKSIIQNNIYGVDIEQGAVDIARLRFWLSLVVDSTEPEPLPNLDYKIMQGNSLLECCGNVDLSNLIYSSLAVSRSEVELLRKKIEKFFSENNHVAKLNLRHEIDDIIRSCIRASGVTGNIELPNTNFFLWHTYFFDVFMQGGFDVVIGNPPYGAKVSKEEKALYKAKYITAKTIPQRQKGSTDTYTVFIEQGYRLLRRGGMLAYIVPISLTSSESLTGVHRLLFNNCDEIKISSYAVRPKPVFENAVVNTSILLFRKTETPCTKLLSTKMHRKGRGFNLQKLIDNLSFVDVRDCCLKGRIPKIGTQMEKNILKKVLEFRKIGSFVNNTGIPIYYRTTGGRYFKVVTNYSTGSTKETNMPIEHDLADSVGCILSSSLSFWFYQIMSNNLDWKSYEIESFTIPPLTQDNIEHLNRLYQLYLTDIERNANVRVSSGKSSYKVDSFKEYKIGRSKR